MNWLLNLRFNFAQLNLLIKIIFLIMSRINRMSNYFRFIDSPYITHYARVIVFQSGFMKNFNFFFISKNMVFGIWILIGISNWLSCFDVNLISIYKCIFCFIFKYIRDSCCSYKSFSLSYFWLRWELSILKGDGTR